jgi:protein SCO1/2
MTTGAPSAPTPASSAAPPSQTQTKSGPESWLIRFGQAAQERAARFAGNPWNWLILVVLFCTFHITRAVTRDPPVPPALRLPLPAFELTNQRGQRFTLDDLKGRVWVADFVFTSCPTVCPKLTKRMAEIQHRSRNLGPAFHLVTFTVDPENDTPERLAEYAKAYHANPGRWTFLTGALGQVETTVVKGFKMAMGKEETSPGIFEIFHGERLVLVDKEGSIRGYYEATDESIKVLMRDIGILVNVTERRAEPTPPRP